MNDKVIPDLDTMPEKNINRIGFLGNFSPFSKTTSNLFYFVLLFNIPYVIKHLHTTKKYK